MNDDPAEDFHLRQAAQLMHGIDDVRTVDVLEYTQGDPTLEVTVWGGVVPPAVLDVLSTYDCALAAQQTGTQGDDPMTTMVVARPY